MLWLISVEKTRPAYGWDAAEREEGSNTAITTQLISSGVTERISVTPSMFTQPDGGGGGERRRAGRERGAASFSSLYILSCISSGICSFMERFYCPEQINSTAT